MELVSQRSIDIIIEEVKKFFAAVETLKLADNVVNDLILKRQADANAESDVVEQIISKMLEHEQISREMARDS